MLAKLDIKSTPRLQTPLAAASPSLQACFWHPCWAACLRPGPYNMPTWETVHEGKDGHVPEKT